MKLIRKTIYKYYKNTNVGVKLSEYKISNERGDFSLKYEIK